MIPDESLSSTNMPKPYLIPDDRAPSKTIDYEMGGVALNDSSEGLEVKIWTLRLVTTDGIGSVLISAEDVDEVELFAQAEITEISLAFDQNMNPAVAYLQSGEARLRWYDATIPGFTVLTLPEGTDAPKICMDDKRALQTSTSDMILCYTRSNNLYFRAQRDRFLIEYLLKEGVVGQVLKLGMNYNNRLQIAVGVFE